MLSADMVIGSVDATLEQGKEPLNCVGRYANSVFVSAILIIRVVHLVMRAGMDCPCKTVQASVMIRAPYSML
jgi:hypothetical protein